MIYPMGPAEAVAVPFDATHYADGLMRQLADALQDTEVHTCVASGEIEDALPDLIAQNAVDWIVLGTHGRSGIRKFLLGSVAEQILRVTHVPALTLGPHILSGNVPEVELKKILCVVDFSSQGERALAYAFSLAQEYQSRLTLLHVVRGYSQVPEAERDFLVRKFSRLLRELAPPEADLWCQPEYVVEMGEHPERTLDSAAYRGADLIIQSLVPGLSRECALEVIRHAPCPVLTVHN
jgi:nucleotide-binding universal stress UspA family protein